MIFQYSYEKVIDGAKTQTRRVVDSGDFYCMGVVTRNGKAKWQTGQTYSVQPARGKKGVARIRVTWIRDERLHDIVERDARAEGCENREAFRKLWDSIQPQGRRWEDNPLVWVLEFELVG